MLWKVASVITMAAQLAVSLKRALFNDNRKSFQTDHLPSCKQENQSDSYLHILN